MADASAARSRVARAVVALAVLAPTFAAARVRVLATEALDPPLQARTGAEPLELRAFALAGTSARFGLTLVADETSEVRLSDPLLASERGSSASGTCRFVLAWEQRDAVNPRRTGADPRQRVRELLSRTSLGDLDPAATPPTWLAVDGPTRARLRRGETLPVLVEIAVPPEARGTLSGTLEVAADGEVLAIPLRVDVVHAPSGFPDRACAFYRSTLGGSGAERASESEIARDLALLRRVGLTHVTCYDDLASAPRFHELARAAGLGVVQVGWPAPRPEATATDVQAAILAVRAQGDRFRSADGAPPLLWLGDEPVGWEVDLVARRSGVAAAAGALSTATLRANSAALLAPLLDVPMLDATEGDRAAFTSACEASLRAGGEPWQYWQAWPESGALARWHAGFKQLSEPTRGQAFYALLHAMGSPWDDFDAPLKDLAVVLPLREALVETVQLEGLEAGLEDLRIARAAAAVVRRCTERGQDEAVRALDRELTRASARWRVTGRRSGLLRMDDVASPEAPSAAGLEDTRQDILRALAQALAECPFMEPR